MSSFFTFRVLKFRATPVAKLSGVGSLGSEDFLLPVTLALPIVLHVCSLVPRATCQGSSVWPPRTSAGNLEYLSIP